MIKWSLEDPGFSFLRDREKLAALKLYSVIALRLKKTQAELFRVTAC